MILLERSQDVFLNALEIESASVREAYLQAECKDDQALRLEVESLLEHAGRMGRFMDGSRATDQAGTSPTVAQQPAPGSSNHGSFSNVRPGTRIGPYKIREQIGEGGMGAVYVAEQIQPVRRKVAIKLIRAGMATKDVIARFDAERQALAMMDHPSIARVFDGGATDSGQPYFVMELVQGVPITDFCTSHRLTIRQRLELFLNMCNAVEHAHRRGVIHRDLKPSNVLVADIDGKPIAKIIDFGVAKAVTARLTDQTVYTQFTQMIGTPLYMSPEQAGMGVIDVDTRSDVYSVGVMLYELLTDHTPFDGQRLKQLSFDEMRRVIREEEPKRPTAMISTLSAEKRSTLSQRRGIDERDFNRAMSNELDWIVMKSLEKDRERRYDSVRALSDDIHRYLSNEPVTACPPSTAYKVRKYIERNRASLLTAAMVLGLLVVGIIGTTWQAISASQERDRAIKAEQRAVAEADYATAINEFLQNDLLGMAELATQSQAGLSPNPNISLRTVLDRAAAHIAQRFGQRPLVDAGIRMTLGKAYSSLGEYELAMAHFAVAKELREDTLGEVAEESIEAELSLLQARRDKAGFATESDILRHAQLVEHCEAVFGETAEITLRAMREKLSALLMRGDLIEAETLISVVLYRYEQSLGPDHRDTLECKIQLGKLLNAQGRYRESEEVLWSTYAILQHKLHPDHPASLNAASALGSVLMLLGNFSEAEELIRQTLSTKQQVFGDTHLSTHAEVRQLADCFFLAGRHTEAEKLWRDLCDQLKQQLGTEHPCTLTSNQGLATCLEFLGKSGEAEQITRDTVAALTRVLGPSHHSTLSCKNLLARYLKPPEAEQLFRQLLEETQSTLGESHVNYLRTKQSLAFAIALQNRLAESVGMLREVHDALKKSLGPLSPSALSCLSSLAAQESNSGQLGEAEKLMREVISLRSQSFGIDHPSTLNDRNNLGITVDKQGRKREAAEIFLRSVEIEQQAGLWPHPVSRRSANGLAGANAAWLESLLSNETDIKQEELRKLLESLETSSTLLPDYQLHTINLALGQAVQHWSEGKLELALQSYAKAAAWAAGMKPIETEDQSKVLPLVETLLRVDTQLREKIIRDFYEKIEEDDAPGLVRRGKWYFFQGEPRQAIKNLTTAFALSANTQTAAALVAAGDSCAQIGDESRAIQFFTQAFEIGDNNGEKSRALEQRANSYRRLGKLDPAMRDYSASISWRPPWHETWNRHNYFWRAVVNRDLHQYEQALADCLKSIELGSTTDQEWALLKEAYELLGDIYAENLLRLTEAIAGYEKALEIDPENEALANKLASAKAARDSQPDVVHDAETTAVGSRD